VSRPLTVLVTGGSGTVATALLAGAPEHVTVHATWRSRPPSGPATPHRIELTDAAAVAALVADTAADVVVHTAYSMSERADVVDTTACVAAACAASGAALVHLSTDAVFDGDHPPYREGDRPSPVSDYGAWKLEAEELAVAGVPDVCITRTSLVVGIDPPDPASARLLESVRAGEGATLFHDELRQPILAADLAAELWALVALERSGRAGIWHLPGAEVLSRLELGERVCERVGLPSTGLRPGSQADHPGRRPRDLTMLAGRRELLGHPPQRI